MSTTTTSPSSSEPSRAVDSPRSGSSGSSRSGSGSGRPWVTAGLTGGGSVLAVLTLVRVLSGWPDQLWLGMSLSLLAAAIAGTAAVLSRHSPGLERWIAELGGVAVAVVGLVLIVVVIVVGFGRIPDENERALVVLVLAAATMGGVLFDPMRRTARTRLARIVSGEVATPDAVLDLLGRRISRDLPIDELLLQVTEVLHRTMSVDAAEVWVTAEGTMHCRASIPNRQHHPITLDGSVTAVATKSAVVGATWLRVWMPGLLVDRHDHVRAVLLSFGGELLGVVVVERSTSDLDSIEETVLAESGRQLGLVLHNTQLDRALQATLDEVRRQARELEASRRRLVSAADEERRRIERNLHDGAQQHLVALSVGLNLAKDMTTDDPAAAVEMLGGLQGAVQDTIDELRALAHGIYPPLLRDSGLGAALRAAAARNPLDVTVDDVAIERPGADVEAAVYFCCLEALQNAAKHAPDSSVAITLNEREGGLFFEVADDGPGFDPAMVQLSAGFINMSDRVGAVGGQLGWDTRPGAGVRITGVIPLAR